MRIELIAFDADDTLWHNEVLYANAQAQFKQLLAAYHPPQVVDERLLRTETRNLEYFGYGIKGFTLSMIETAIELTEGRISGREIQRIVELGRGMLRAEVQLMDHAQEALARLAPSYPLMLITKGDLLDQQSKIKRSGLAPYFKYVEVVSDKTQEQYRQLLERHTIAPANLLMVGNSLRSDILPILALGGQAVYIPYHLTWAHEKVAPPERDARGFYELEHLGQLPDLIARIAHASA